MYRHTLCLIAGAIGPIYGAATTVSPAAKAPTTAAGPIDHSFIGFGIESSSLPDYSGNLSAPNKFSAQLIENVSNRTGAPVFIRVGGTSLDNAQYIPSQGPAIIRPASQEGLNVPIGITLGPAWFQGFQTLPAKWILGVPLQHSSVEQSVQFTQAGVNAITAANLQSIEIGNEPNYYGISSQQYLADFHEYSAAISGNISLPAGPTYQGLAVSSDAAYPPWDIPTLFADGAGSQNNLKSVSYHYYQTTHGHNISTTLLNHTDTVSHLTNFTSSINYLSTTAPYKFQNISFVIGEVGSALNGQLANGTQLNDFALESVLGSAVWTVDFLLYSLSIGVGRVSLQQITGGGFDGWQPIAYDTTLYGLEQPAVKPNYYGYLLAADFIGNRTSAGVQVANIDLHSESAAAYAAYEGGALERVVVVNTQYWLSASGAVRPSTTFQLSVPEGVSSVRVDKLQGPGDAESVDGITYAGQSYSYQSGGAATAANDGGSEVLSVANGQLSLTVPAVEAWLVTLLR